MFLTVISRLDFLVNTEYHIGIILSCVTMFFYVIFYRKKYETIQKLFNALKKFLMCVFVWKLEMTDRLLHCSVCSRVCILNNRCGPENKAEIEFVWSFSYCTEP